MRAKCEVYSAGVGSLEVQATLHSPSLPLICAQGGGALAAISTQYARMHAPALHELTASERIALHYTPLALYWSPRRMPPPNSSEMTLGVSTSGIEGRRSSWALVRCVRLAAV